MDDYIGPEDGTWVEIVADLVARQIRLETEVEAPKDARSRDRISWLLRQLTDAPGQVAVETRQTKTAATLAGVLSSLREDPAALLPADPSREIRAFRVSLTRDLRMNRAGGKGSFIDGVIDAVTLYYRDVLQNLTAWRPKPPKLRAQQAPVELGTADIPQPIDEALEAAEEQQPDNDNAADE